MPLQYVWQRRYSPTHLELGIWRQWEVICTSRGDIPQYALNRRVFGPQSRSGRFSMPEIKARVPGSSIPWPSHYTNLLDNSFSDQVSQDEAVWKTELRMESIGKMDLTERRYEGMDCP
jgi:hypothetical protein